MGNDTWFTVRDCNSIEMDSIEQTTQFEFK